MNAQSKENLKELIERFLDDKQAQTYLEDIQAGEKLLRDHPAPRPDDMLIANIKAEIALNVLPRKATFLKQIAYKTFAAAAAIIIITALGINLFQPESNVEPRTTVATASVFPWNSNEDLTFIRLKTQADLIQSDLIALQTSEEDSNNEAINALEFEKAEMDSVFWEG